MLFLYIFGGESVKQVPVNKFVWPNAVKALLLRLFSFNVIINDVPAVSLGQPNLSREQGHQLYIRATSSALLGWGRLNHDGQITMFNDCIVKIV